MKKLIKKLLTNWVVRNFPFVVTTKVNHVKTIYIKKGKIREWRSYDENHNRIELVK